MTAPSASEFLLGGGDRKGRSASFLTIGATFTGLIIEQPEVRQQNDPDTGLPKTWDNGDPMWQIVVTCDTDQRKPEIENDDGVRYLYISGSKKPESLSMHVAVRDAVQAAGVDGLEKGGRITVTYIGDGEKAPGASAVRSKPKQYSATYIPAASVALMAPDPAAAPAAAAPTAAAPAVNQAQIAALGSLTPEQQAAALAALVELGAIPKP
jgi:hypothetical protein